MKKHVLIVGGYDSRFESFKGIDVEFSIIQEAGMLGNKQTELTNNVIELEEFTSSSVYEAALEINNKKQIDFIFSFIEEGLYPSAYASKLLGIKGMDYDVHSICIKKDLLREKLKGTKFEVKSIVSDDFSAAKDFFIENGCKVVMKDPEGSGSENVYLCDSENKLIEAWERTGSLDVSVRLLEEYIEGEEYSLETITLNGKHHFLGATKTYFYPGQMVEGKHVFPAPDLTDESLPLVENYAKNLLREIGYVHGPCHIEVRVNGNEVNLIEVNNRSAGGFIWQLVLEATGVDMLRETITNAFNGNNELNRKDSSNIKSEYASFVLYNKIDTEFLEKNIKGAIKIFTLYCELNKVTYHKNGIYDANDVCGFLVGKGENIGSINKWLNEIEINIEKAKLES